MVEQVEVRRVSAATFSTWVFDHFQIFGGATGLHFLTLLFAASAWFLCGALRPFWLTSLRGQHVVFDHSLTKFGGAVGLHF